MLATARPSCYFLVPCCKLSWLSSRKNIASYHIQPAAAVHISVIRRSAAVTPNAYVACLIIVLATCKWLLALCCFNKFEFEFE